MKRLIVVALLASVGLPLLGGVQADAAPRPAPKAASRIQHFITVMQTGHTFDNYFGTFPGADGLPKTTCVPVDPAAPAGSTCVKPFELGGREVTGLAHTGATFAAQLNGGAMNGFVAAVAGHGDLASRQPLGYYDDSTIPYYWHLARDYVLFDKFFTAAGDGSTRNHFYWVTGQSGSAPNEAIHPGTLDSIQTIFDRLQAAGVSWKYYIQNYDPAVTYRTPTAGPNAAQLTSAPILNFNRFLDDPKLKSHIVPLDEYYQDLANGTLPAVSYIAPTSSSEQPPGDPDTGQRLTRSLVNSLTESSAWSSSAFLLSYADWGGWYDHVAPPKVDAFGEGFRSPALLVSPFAKRGLVDHTTLDTTAILAFIEKNWGVQPLSDRDAKANSFLSAFDFSHARAPSLQVGPDPTPAVTTKPAGVVYAFYGVAVVVTMLLIGWTSLTRRRREAVVA